MTRRRAFGLTIALSIAASACGSTTTTHSGSARVRVRGIDFPVALAPDGAGGLLFAERVSGRVRRVDAAGRLVPEPVARVAVSVAGQRGLLGVAVDGADRVFAAYTGTGPGRPILVAEVVPESRPVWSGPPSAKLANGGHLVYDPHRARLVIGIGDLLDRARSADPTAPNGKLLLLDPDGPPDQRPAVLSARWNNPFAFALTDAGALWVADNVPGEKACHDKDSVLAMPDCWASRL
ncbi:MAG: PQQ-dependent sugar dehydrogenase, partial [Acidimicrobiia bacterium]